MSAPTRQIKVLLADGNRSSLAITKEFLERSGYQVVAAHDGLEAVEIACSERPDVVLLDPEMPRMSGYQVCRVLKMGEQTGRIPVVMLASMDQPGDRYRGLQAGADGYVAKESLTAVKEALSAALSRADERCDTVIHETTCGSTNVLELLSRLNEILDRSLYEATIVGEMTKLAWSATDLDRTTRDIMALFGRLFDFHLACLLVRSDDAATADLLWMVRTPLEEAALTASEEAVLAAFSERCGVRVDPRAVRRRTVAASQATAAGGAGNAIVPGSLRVVPLGTQDRQAGIFALWAGERVASSQESLQMIAVLANTASLVLDNARLYQEMRRMATTDGLTSLGNYRLLQESLEREFQRSRRTGEPMALLMLDLDNFKQVNDTYGHKIGDQVLQNVALAFMRNARQYDLIARYGGEEFAVVLPVTTLEGAVEVAERFRLLVRSVAARTKIDWLSASVGVAACPSHRIKDAQGLVREADAALYRAKNQGKNRVWVAPLD